MGRVIPGMRNSMSKGQADSERDFVRELQRVGCGLRRIHVGPGMVGGPPRDASWVRSTRTTGDESLIKFRRRWERG